MRVLSGSSDWHDTSSGHGAVSRARRLACPWPAAAYHSARCDTAVLVARPTSSPSSSRAPPSRTRPAPARQPLDYNYYNCTVVPPASRLLFRSVVVVVAFDCRTSKLNTECFVAVAIFYKKRMFFLWVVTFVYDKWAVGVTFVDRYRELFATPSSAPKHVLRMLNLKILKFFLWAGVMDLSPSFKIIILCCSWMSCLVILA